MSHDFPRRAISLALPDFWQAKRIGGVTDQTFSSRRPLKRLARETMLTPGFTCHDYRIQFLSFNGFGEEVFWPWLAKPLTIPVRTTAKVACYIRD